MSQKEFKKIFRFQHLLQKEGWINDAYIETDRDGIIQKISSTNTIQSLSGSLSVEYIEGFALPGHVNAHSHAFQYAMAGLAEHKSQKLINDDFWTWREAMYSLASRITPDQMEAVASQVYAEMLRHGFTAVTEFHYVHHNPEGQVYPHVAEMSERIIRAAERTGIYLTLVPVMYEQGGFNQPLKRGQIRFRTFGIESYHHLFQKIELLKNNRSDINVGIGIHSLRAVSSEEILQLLSEPRFSPVHLHVAEQQREVDDCISYLKKRPVSWLLDNLPIDDRFNLVHATHMNDDEAKALGLSGAAVVLCPSTEGNLGDGFFPLSIFRQNGGKCAIGTDSQIGLSPWEELRWLDYVQRLRLEKRNIISSKEGDDSGFEIFTEAWHSGMKAVGRQSHNFFSVGSPLDAIIIDPDHPLFIGKPKERLVSTAIYGGESSILKGTIRRGKWLVRNGHHCLEDQIKSQYKSLFQNFWD